MYRLEGSQWTDDTGFQETNKMGAGAWVEETPVLYLLDFYNTSRITDSKVVIIFKKLE